MKIFDRSANYMNPSELILSKEGIINLVIELDNGDAFAIKVQEGEGLEIVEIGHKLLAVQPRAGNAVDIVAVDPLL